MGSQWRLLYWFFVALPGCCEVSSFASSPAVKCLCFCCLCPRSFTFLYDLKRAIVGAFFWEAQQEAAALAQARAMHLGLVGLFNNAVVGQSTDVCLQQFGRFYTALQAVANTTGLQLY